MSDPSTTYPAAITVLSGETLPVGIDFAMIVGTATISSPTGALFDITSSSPGTPVQQGGSPSVAGTVVSLVLTQLTAGHRYRLILGGSAGSNVWQAAVIVECPY